MNDGRAADPGPGLAGRIAAQSAIAATLIDLEGHPAHQLLSAAGLTGTTAQRWATGKVQLAQLWTDFGTYQSVVAQAGDTDDPAVQRQAAHGPVRRGRAAGAGRSASPASRWRSRASASTSSPRGWTARSARSAHCCAACRSTTRPTSRAPHRWPIGWARPAASPPPSTRNPSPYGPRALSTRLHELDGAAAADPLGAGEPAALAGVEAISTDVEKLAGRLAEAARLRGGWAAEIAEAATAVTAVEDLRRRAAAARERATEIVIGPVAELPEDHTRELRSRLAALDRGSWTTRATALAELQAAVAAARAELTTAHDLATGLIDRRAELRGRFEAYRAKSVRLGRAEEPELLALADEIGDLLWTRPCDLGAGTRALAAYQRALGRTAGTITADSGEEESA